MQFNPQCMCLVFEVFSVIELRIETKSNHGITFAFCSVFNK